MVRERRLKPATGRWPLLLPAPCPRPRQHRGTVPHPEHHTTRRVPRQPFPHLPSSKSLPSSPPRTRLDTSYSPALAPTSAYTSANSTARSNASPAATASRKSVSVSPGARRGCIRLVLCVQRLRCVVIGGVNGGWVGVIQSFFALVRMGGS